jgi:hypothetical protein
VEVVQVYGGLPSSTYERPAWRLLGFARVEVPAGATRDVEIAVSLWTLAVRQHGAWRLEPGRYAIAIARHAGDPDAAQLAVSLDPSTAATATRPRGA